MYTCFVYSEGRLDRYFLESLMDLDEFINETTDWSPPIFSNGRGISAKTILTGCYRESRGRQFDLILCIIDLDDLKHDFPSTWIEEKKLIEEKYLEIKVIWQVENAEDEYRRVIPSLPKEKDTDDAQTRKQINKFINSDFWNRILSEFRQRESELEIEELEQ